MSKPGKAGAPGTPGKSGKRRRRDPNGSESPLRRRPSAYGDRSVRVVYVAAEGGKTEGDYVRWLDATYGSRQLKIRFCDPGENGARPEEVVRLALGRASASDDEMWALFDRDSDSVHHRIAKLRITKKAQLKIYSMTEEGSRPPNENCDQLPNRQIDQS